MNKIIKREETAAIEAKEISAEHQGRIVNPEGLS